MKCGNPTTRPYSSTWSKNTTHVTSPTTPPHPAPTLPAQTNTLTFTVNGVTFNMKYSKKQPHPVKTKQANELGIYDMSGNVFEWCQDWYGEYGSESQDDPTGPVNGTKRVMRGGSYATLWWSFA